MDNKHIYLTLKEVAEYLNVSLGYARKIAKDKICHYRFGCRIYVDKNDLDRWIAAQKNPPNGKFNIEDLVGPIKPLLIFLCVYVPQISYPFFSANGHLGGFHVLAIVHSAAMDIGVHVH